MKPHSRSVTYLFVRTIPLSPFFLFENDEPEVVRVISSAIDRGVQFGPDFAFARRAHARSELLLGSRKFRANLGFAQAVSEES